MDQDEEASVSSPFAPRAALVRTPPSGLAPPPRVLPRGDGDENMALTPTMPARPPRPPAPPGPPPAASALGGPPKRPLTSPEERRPVDVVRRCRPTGTPPDPPAPPAPAATATTAARAAPAAGATARAGRATSYAASATSVSEPGSAMPSSAASEVSDDESGDEVEHVDGSLAGASKTQLLDRAHRGVEAIMSAVTGPTSRLNKDATNAISGSCREIVAVVAALALKLGDYEVELSHAKLRAAEAEREVLRTKLQPVTSVSSSASAPKSFATALKTSKKAELVPIPAAQGPVLAFYPAPEHVEQFRSAEDTKSELKKHIKPQEMNIQVDRLRKIGNAGVVVQTTTEASAEKLRRATPATLRVTEPKRRSPLVSLRHLDGDGDLDFVMKALHEQNFEGSEWTPERLRAQSRLAFKKRGRGTTTVVLECSPKLREALLAKDRLYIGWQVIEVVDFLSVTCCRKCHQYGHPEKYCRATEVFCGRCGASGHRREECTSASECCATCKRFNKPDAATHTTAAAVCPARQYAESRTISSTNYGQ